MFPFQITYKGTIEKPYHSSKVSKMLEIVNEELKWSGSEYITLGKNRIDFDNRIFTIRVPFSLMHSIDGGFLKIENTRNRTFQVEYEISTYRI